jgi:hypothetical protein
MGETMGNIIYLLIGIACGIALAWAVVRHLTAEGRGIMMENNKVIAPFMYISEKEAKERRK